MKKFQLDFTIISSRRVGADYRLMILKSVDTPLPEMMPGQFVNILVPDSKETMLRRPISIHDVDYDAQTLHLLVKPVGAGTKKLCSIAEGERLNILVPLGNGFDLNIEPGRHVLLVGGGVGSAPLLFLARQLNAKGVHVDTLIGARSSDQIAIREEFANVSQLFITTEDGSEGTRGFVTNHESLLQPDYDKIMCCGPNPMMKAVAKIAHEHGIDCQVSLENTMACGLGACLCCVEDTRSGNQCVCTSGPVFNINDLKWNADEPKY